uniref:glycine zipper 2TM domain-containing protein n=1 Tax=uncultured Erythrobacter sp. TaxID=263913 RepID=UPI00260A38E9|nr:glycine zipper 2TM domain-containing protein [uncultured Erythrobacter sp.]
MSLTARKLACITLSASVIAIASPAAAQMSDADVSQLPADLRTAPVQQNYSETTTGPDGVETVIRTRRIESRAPAQSYYEEEVEYAAPRYYAPAHSHAPIQAPAAAVVEREQWVEECERRTNGRNEKDKGGIIGGLVGAVAGGLLGNRIAGDGDRLAGTLIGAGTGGLGGVLLGNLIGGGKKGDRYDCAAALDSYLSQYGQGGQRFASRTIPAPVMQAPVYGYPAYAAPAQYSYAPAYTYTYQPPQQVVYVPIRYEQQQRVVVRETIREETYEVPGAAREIPAPAPVRMIKEQPVRVTPAPAPRPVKMIKQ